MQIKASATFGLGTLGVTSVGDSLALFTAGGQAFLYFDTGTANGFAALPLGPVTSPGSGYLTAGVLGGDSALSLQPGSGMTVQQSGTTTRVFSYGAIGGTLMVQTVGTSGLLSTATAVVGALTGVHTFEILGGPTGSMAALSFWDQAGLSIYALSSSGALSLESLFADTSKTYLGDVSDTLSVTVGGTDYLLSLSSLEGGITAFAVDAGGTASLIDSLGTIDGLPLSGAAAMQSMVVGGVTYVVIAATNSSALSVVRVNEMGCLFVTDTLYDDLTTRFAQAQVLECFTWAGRSFVVTGGTDAGISVFEMRPDGKLVPTATGVFETGAGLENITGLAVAVSGSQAEIYVVDETNQKILKYTIDLSALGEMITAGSGATTGSSLGDFIWGSSSAQTLNGGGGDDLIYDGAGSDTLTGGAGADVFLLAADQTADRISDYQLHSDRIDLSDWGAIYSTSALTITSTSNGATISWGGETVTVVSSDGKSLSAASFSNDDFIFL